MGPHPYPWMVRELHRVIGDEAREQCRALTGGDPDVVVACVGGGSNAIGIFSGFVDLPDVELVGAEPAGGAAVGPGRARRRPRVEVVPACRTSGARCSRPSRSPPASTTRASAPSTPTCADLRRARYEPVTDAEVLDAFELLARTEGIIPALESAHALAWCHAERAALAGRTVLVNLSGRGDKDVAQVARLMGADLSGTGADGLEAG